MIYVKIPHGHSRRPGHKFAGGGGAAGAVHSTATVAWTDFGVDERARAGERTVGGSGIGRGGFGGVATLVVGAFSGGAKKADGFAL